MALAANIVAKATSTIVNSYIFEVYKTILLLYKSLSSTLIKKEALNPASFFMPLIYFKLPACKPHSFLPASHHQRPTRSC